MLDTKDNSCSSLYVQLTVRIHHDDLVVGRAVVAPKRGKGDEGPQSGTVPRLSIIRRDKINLITVL